MINPALLFISGGDKIIPITISKAAKAAIFAA